MTKNPYRFPARSRSAMIAAMESIGGYSGWNAPSRRAYPFAWNVKIHRFPSSARELGDNPHSSAPFNPAWDSAWDKYCEESDWLFGSICEDMASGLDGYSTYPGDDSGEFAFTFGGRSGGWLILDSAYGMTMAGLDFAELADPEAYTFAEVRKLYRAIMTMDSDFADSKVAAEFAYQCAFRRSQWEEERREELAQTVAEVTSDQVTARRLLGELRALKRLPNLAAFTASCDALRSAIRNAIGDARDGRRKALALATGEESGE